MKKQILACLLSLVMVVSLLPASALAAGEATELLDLSTNSITVEQDGSYTVSSLTTTNTITIKSGVTCSLTISELNITASNAPAIRVEAGATLHLTVEGTNTLKGGPSYAGISVAAGWDGNDYSPETSGKVVIDGTGVLNVTGGDADKTAGVGGGAGIGGDGFHEDTNPNGADFGVIEIKGGTINATGGSTTTYYYGTGAGIGGGAGLSYPLDSYLWTYSGTINISGGDVTAQGGDGIGSAGIGGAAQGNNNYSDCGYLDISISGGTIKATGGAAAAGIGGSYAGDHGNIEITGGTIEAIGAAEDPIAAGGGAGIGGGADGGGYTITIGGEAKVIARGGGAGAGIGGGNGGYSDAIIIEGNANVTAYGGFPPERTSNKRGGAGIGSGNNVNIVNSTERYETIKLNTTGNIIAYGGKGAQAIGLGTCAPVGNDNTKNNHLSVTIGENIGEIWMFNYDNDQSAMYAVDVTNNTVDGTKLTLGDKNALYWNGDGSSAWYQFGSDSDNTTHTWSADGDTLTISKGSETVASCGYDTVWHEATDNWAMIKSLPKYTVSFVPDNGQTIPAQQIVHDSTVKEPSPAPQKPGYVFDGWYTGTEDVVGNITLDSPYDFDTPVTADITLYAKWSVDKSLTHTVTYYDMDGQVYEEKEVQGGEKAPELMPFKPGHVFVGWYADEQKTALYDFDTPVIGDLSLYARFVKVEVKIEIKVQIDVDIIGTDRDVVSIGDDQKDDLAQNVDFKTDVGPDTTMIEIDAIVKEADSKAELDEITKYLTENQYNCGSNRIDYDVAVQKIIYTNGIAGTPQQLHRLAAPIQITFAIPTAWQSGGTVSMFCAHVEEGGATAVEKLTDLDGNAATYTVKSDKFSTYTMIYVPTPAGGGEGGEGGNTTYYTLHYESNGGTKYSDERYAKDTLVQLDKVPVRVGFQFTGWYADKDLTERITAIKMIGDKTVYAGWRSVAVPDMLNGGSHFAYVAGYPDGTVRPDASITRAETAAIFFRLLKPEIREGSLERASVFADVSDGMWCCTAVSTMAKLGIVKGRTAETFDPNAPITRAEFAVICARFDGSLTGGGSSFTDISGHWAEEEIGRAASLGWIQGYGDGTFRPDAPITRAEAMTVINRVLCRIPENEADLLPGMNVWPDNQPDDWHYLAVQEATNSHEFRCKGETYEHWTALTDDPDWTRYQG